MKKNNLVAAIAAIVMTTVSTPVSASPCYSSDPAYELGAPICIMNNEDIPQEAWNDIRNKFDYDSDGEMHVADAIRARKDGKNEMSDAICRFIINDGYDKGISLSPSLLEPIANSIRDPYIDLISFWRGEDGGLAYFMFMDETNATIHVSETYTMTSEQGFIKIWDQDDDQVVTEKDAAMIYLDGPNGCNEDIAIAASEYSQHGTSGFIAHATNEGTIVENLKKVLGKFSPMVGDTPNKEESSDHCDIVSVSTDSICIFDYDEMTVKYIYY